MDVEQELTPASPPDSAGAWNPSRYYSQPPSDLSRRRTGAIGCGFASIAILIFLFFAGGFFASGGIRMLIGYAIDQIAARINDKTAPDLSEPERAAIRQKLESVVAMSRNTSVPLQKIVPVLEKVQSGLADEKLDRREAQGITDAVNEMKKPATGPAR